MNREENADLASDCDCSDRSIENSSSSKSLSARFGSNTDDKGQTTTLSTGPSINSSVDSCRNDTGYLPCMERNYGASPNNASAAHATTKEAFDNLRASAADVSVIAGHGQSGILVTGTGRIISTTDCYMAVTNSSVWGPDAAAGVSGNRLVLFGCHVAASPGGARLLNDVANLVRKEVGAWTGLVWCSGPRVWGEGEFLVAIPGKDVGPRDAPVMFDSSVPQRPMKIHQATGYEEVTIGQILGLNYSPIGTLPGQIVGGNVAMPAANSIIKEINFANPFETNDRPGAILTGQLTVFYSSNDPPVHTHARTFLVLAYSLLQDVCFPTVYYYASPNLRQQFENAAYS